MAGPATYGRANLLVEYKRKPYVYKNKPIPGGRDKELASFRLSGDEALRRKAKRLTRAFKRMGGTGGPVQATNEASIKWLADTAVSNLNEKSKAHGRPQNFRSGKLAQVIRSPKSHVVSTVGFRFMDEKKVRAQIDYAFSLEYGDRSQIGRDIYFLFLGKRPNRGSPAKANKGTSQNAADRINFHRQFNHQGDNNEAYRFSHRPSLARSTHPFFGVQHHTDAAGRNARTTSDRLIGPRELHTGGKGGGAFKSGFIVNGRRFQVKIKNPVPAYRYGRDARDKFLSEDVYETLLQKRFDAGPEKAAGVVLTPGLKAAKRVNRVASNRRKKGNAGRQFPVTTTKIGA